MRLFRTAILVMLPLSAVGLFAYFALGSWLIAPAQGILGDPPESLKAESVRIPSNSGSRLAAWAAQGTCECGAIVLMHGVRSNRLSLIGRAELLLEAGYSVLLVDLQAHGESSGDYISFGHLERLDAQAAVDFVSQRFPGEPVGVIGISLGGAAAALAGQELNAEAVVLESVYADIESATKNRLQMRLGRLGSWLAPVLLRQLPLRIEASAADLRPVEGVRMLEAPVLIVAGTEDVRTRPADTRRLYEAAGSPKRLWWVEGAEHEDYFAFDAAGYEAEVVGFLNVHLRDRAG